MDRKLIISLIAAPLLLVSCGQKKQSNDIIVQDVEAPKLQAPIRMQDYRQSTNVQWLGKDYQVEVSRSACDSLPMVKDELGQQYVDNKIVMRVIRADGSVFCTKTFTKSAFSSSLDDDYRKTGILEGFVFDKAEGNQLFFAASVSHPQTDEYIPLVVTVSNFAEVGIKRDDTIE